VTPAQTLRAIRAVLDSDLDPLERMVLVTLLAEGEPEVTMSAGRVAARVGVGLSTLKRKALTLEAAGLLARRTMRPLPTRWVVGPIDGFDRSLHPAEDKGDIASNGSTEWATAG